MNVDFKSCSCFGHNKINVSKHLKEKLMSIFKELISKENVKYFYFGGFGEFDDLCHSIITELKNEYPEVYRIFCLSDLRHQRLSKRPEWLKDEDYEEITYLDLNFDCWYSKIYYRNCEIIDHSDYCVFCVDELSNMSVQKKHLNMQKGKRKK